IFLTTSWWRLSVVGIHFLPPFSRLVAFDNRIKCSLFVVSFLQRFRHLFFLGNWLRQFALLPSRVDRNLFLVRLDKFSIYLNCLLFYLFLEALTCDLVLILLRWRDRKLLNLDVLFCKLCKCLLQLSCVNLYRFRDRAYYKRDVIFVQVQPA